MKHQIFGYADDFTFLHTNVCVCMCVCERVFILYGGWGTCNACCHVHLEKARQGRVLISLVKEALVKPAGLTGGDYDRFI